MVSVLAGNGDGTFRAAQSSAAGSGPRSLVPDDRTGDRKDDLTIGGQTFFSVFIESGYYGNYYEYHSDGYVNVLLSYSDGTFALPQTSDLGTHDRYGSIGSPALRDFTGDGRP